MLFILIIIQNVNAETDIHLVYNHAYDQMNWDITELIKIENNDVIVEIKFCFNIIMTSLIIIM